MSGFNFRVLFTNATSHLKKGINVIVGRCSITDFFFYSHAVMASVCIKYLNMYTIH